MPIDFTLFKAWGMPEIILWLLSFAIVYGVTSQVGIPKDKNIRAIIALVFAFFVLFAVPGQLITFISQMGTSMLVIILLIIIFLVFIEAAGVKITQYGKNISETEKEYLGEKSIFQEYWMMFAFAFLIIGVLVFVGAGGLNLLGVSLNLEGTPSMTLMFLGIIILAIVWLVANPGEKE